MSKIIFDFSGENFVVTGASSGMGRDVAISLGKAGAKVLAVGRNVERLQATKDECPDNIFTVSADVCDTDAMEKAIKDFVGEHGKLNGCVHAAGITDITPIRSYDKENAHKVMDISFWAGVDLLQIVSKNKHSVEGASYVLFSSVAAEATLKGMFAYSGTKAVVNAAVSCIAKDLSKKKQRVNSVMPGWVKSEMTVFLGGVSDMDDMNSRELLGFGEPSDVTGMVMFLLSDRARWITGTNIAVDGGFLA